MPEPALMRSMAAVACDTSLCTRTPRCAKEHVFHNLACRDVSTGFHYAAIVTTVTTCRRRGTSTVKPHLFRVARRCGLRQRVRATRCGERLSQERRREALQRGAGSTICTEHRALRGCRDHGLDSA